MDIFPWYIWLLLAFAVMALFYSFTALLLATFHKKSVLELKLRNPGPHDNYRVFEVVRKVSLKRIFTDVMEITEADSFEHLCFTQNAINAIRAENSDYFQKNSISTMFIKKEFNNIVVDAQGFGIEKKGKLNCFKSFLKTQNGRILVFGPIIYQST